MPINTKKRAWLDSLAANSGLTQEMLERLIRYGYIIVTANAAIDIGIFQKNQGWFENCLRSGKIVIENWLTPDEMVRKPFFWSSCSQSTSPAVTLEDAVKDLPNAADILDVTELVKTYGIPKDQWPKGPWSPPAPLSAEVASKLGLDPATATRTDVLAAAKASHMMNAFDDYNVGYNRGLATQHRCNFIINSNGSVTEI